MKKIVGLVIGLVFLLSACGYKRGEDGTSKKYEISRLSLLGWNV